VTLSGVSRPLAALGVGDPATPPAVVHTQSLQVLHLAATQLSGTPGVDATGDFYDVFPVELPARGDEDTRWWWVVMGDVCGKGVTDARPGPGGECFGLERVTEALAAGSGRSVRAVVDAVTTSALAYRRGFLGDDLALLALSPGG
jgi:hypothetical protein